jgi:hypothetical protein
VLDLYNYYEITNEDRGKRYFFSIKEAVALDEYMKAEYKCQIEIYGRAWRICYDDYEDECIFYNTKPEIILLSKKDGKCIVDIGLATGSLGNEYTLKFSIAEQDYFRMIEYVNFVEDNLAYFKHLDDVDVSYHDKEIATLSGEEFETLIKKLLENMGFDVSITKVSGDGGIDLIAYNPQPIFGGKIVVQCKRWSGPVGEPVIRDLYGVVMSENANKGILITNSYFTSSAINFSKGKQLELIDGIALDKLLEKYMPSH